MCLKNRITSLAFFLVTFSFNYLLATTIIPFSNLGEMAKASPAVVLAKVTNQFEVTYGDETLLRSRLVVKKRIKGSLSEATFFDVQHLMAKGDGWVSVVPEDVNLIVGKTYLMFLAPIQDYWRPMLMSYGVFEEYYYNRKSYLAPLPESFAINILPTSGGTAIEPIGVYDSHRLTQMLKKVVAGVSSWDSQSVLAPEDIAFMLLNSGERVAPAHCTFLQSGGIGFQWLNFPGTALPAHYPSSGDSDCTPATQANTNVVNAISDMTANYAGINVTDGSTYSGFTPNCVGGSAKGGNFTTWVNTNLGGSRHIVIQYQDPCNEITDLSSCAGTLAIGGLYGFTPTHFFDGLEYYSGAYGYVIVNNGVCTCLTSAEYKLMMLHEMTHCLGLGNIASSNGVANMNPACCNAITTLDQDCVDYFYAPVLPIELVSFSVQKELQSANLTWATATELNNDYFTLERSADGVEFAGLAKVPGAGTSLEERRYQWLDEHPLPGDNYYRLRQTDYDGKTTLSKVEVVAFDDLPEAFEIYPNPAGNGTVNLYFTTAATTAAAEVNIFNISRNIVSKFTWNIAPGRNKINLPTDGLSGGIYMVQIIYPRGIKTLRFVKE